MDNETLAILLLLIVLLIVVGMFTLVIVTVIKRVRNSRKRKQARAMPEGMSDGDQNISAGHAMKIQQRENTNEDITNAEQNLPLSRAKVFILFLCAILI